MKTRYGLWMVVAAILSIVAACNYTEGDCYPVGQADGPAAADVGAGVGSGAGGYGSGDAPRSGGTGANACNASPDKSSDDGTSPSGSAPDDAQALMRHALEDPYGAGGVLCTTPIDCLNKCNQESKFCTSEKSYHPQRPPQIGVLYQCTDSWPPAKYGGSYLCQYVYPDESVCAFAYPAHLGPLHPPAPPPFCLYKTK